MTDSTSSVFVASTSTGCCVRVQGRGTVRESRVLKDVGVRTLKGDPAATVVVDLTNCVYVDSTFLGCLLDLFRADAQSKRLSIVAPQAQRKKLLGIIRLDTMIPCEDVPPSVVGDWIHVPAADVTPEQLTRHVIDCHRKLAELNTPMRGIFAQIARQMELELTRLQQ